MSQRWTIFDPNPELTAAFQEAIKKAQQAEMLSKVEEPATKPHSVVEDFDFIRARVQEIKANKQSWWCSQCQSNRTQGCSNSACPNKITMQEDYCYD